MLCAHTEKQLILDQIYNADESRFFWRLLQEITVVHRAEVYAPSHKVIKYRITYKPC